MKLRYLVSMAALSLAACDQAPQKTATATAEGEILPGSASDSMLPLDTLRSQAPLAPKVVSSDAPASPAPRATQTSAVRPAAAAEPAPATAPEPAAEAVSEE
jgi:hypothetical protein